MRIRQYVANKKITIIVVLLILLLTGSIFLNFQLLKFKESQQNGYAQRISHAFSQLNVKADLTDGILLHEKDFKAAEMIAGLEILRDDLFSFTHSFDESKLAGYDPGWIELEWKKSLQEAIRKHPDFILHQRLSMKYVL